MQTQNLPFNFKEVFKLSNLGLNPELFKFGSVTFESQKYICVKDAADCAIIDTTKNFALERKPMKAEGILMHKSENIIALRATQGAKTVIQVFNLETKAKVKQFDVNEQVRYWRWISESKLGIVGKTSVYHCDINDQAAPAKIFDQEGKFANAQIMNYGVDSSDKWCFLIGIYQGANNAICCHMQLFFTEKRQQQILEGFAACFTDMPVTEANDYKNSLFCFCEKKAGEQTQRLHVMEIGNPAPGQQKIKKTADIQVQQEGDFPVLMQDCPKYGVLFIITKMGFLYMYEVSQAALLYRQKITDQLCFVSTRNANTDGMIVINRTGQIFSINVEENNLIPYINSVNFIPDNKTLSFKLAQRFHLPGADDLFLLMFNQKLAASDYAGAASVAKDAPGTLLRNIETINKFKSLPQTGGPPPLLIYFNALINSTTLNQVESIELVKPVIQQNKLNLVENWIKEKKLTMSDELGDIIRQANP